MTTNFIRSLRVMCFNLMQAVFYTLFFNHFRRAVSDQRRLKHLFAFAQDNNLVVRIAYANGGNGAIHTRDIEITDFSGTHVTGLCRLRKRAYRSFKLENVLEARWSGKCYIPAPALQEANSGEPTLLRLVTTRETVLR